MEFTDAGKKKMVGKGDTEITRLDFFNSHNMAQTRYKSHKT